MAESELTEMVGVAEAETEAAYAWALDGRRLSAVQGRLAAGASTLQSQPWRPPGVNASRAVHDPLSCCLDLPSGEMLDLC